MKIKIVNGQVCRQEGTEYAPLSVESYWNYCSNKEVSPEGLNLLGYARIGIKVTDPDSPKLKFTLQTEIGIKDVPESAIFPSDHIVIDDLWIPIEVEGLIDSTEFLKKQNLTHGSSLKTSDLLALLNLRNNSNVLIEINEDLLERDIQEGFNTSLPSGLSVTPYPYQDLGIRWLTSMFDQGIGAMLCDEMGLGKTLQAIGLILHAKQKGAKRILLCTPSSLTLNWQREMKKFAPELDFLAYFGAGRYVHPNKFSELGMVHTSYDVLIRDFPQLKINEWDLVICDEAQLLKNPDSQRSVAVNALKAKTKVLLSGTPIENSLKDLWALTNIVYPGLLGSQHFFFSQIDDNPLDAARVGEAASPLMKRRRVAEVLKDLPPLIEKDEVIPVSQTFAHFYESLRTGSHPKTADSIQIARITALRQFCCYPNLVVSDYPKENDAKFERLHDIVMRVHEKNEKILIFATFTEPINLVKRFIDSNFDDGWCEIIDGRNDADSRMKIIDVFQKRAGFSVLVINPEAGGTGLNITSANHVIHFNLPWNPAKEAQATARVYRPGQESEKVFVHRFFYERTIEDAINQRLQFKVEIADAALVETESVSNEEFAANALRISPLSR